MKLLEENIGYKLYNISLSNYFLVRAVKYQRTNAKTHKRNYGKLKIIAVKAIIPRMKG